MLKKKSRKKLLSPKEKRKLNDKKVQKYRAKSREKRNEYERLRYNSNKRKDNSSEKIKSDEEYLIASFMNNIIPNADVIEEHFEQNALASQLLWYFNSGLHRFSEIDNLPDDDAVKNLINEIEAEVLSFNEKKSIVDDYINFYNKKMILLHVLVVV